MQQATPSSGFAFVAGRYSLTERGGASGAGADGRPRRSSIAQAVPSSAAS
jgi:hypothetical protein